MEITNENEYLKERLALIKSGIELFLYAQKRMTDIDEAKENGEIEFSADEPKECNDKLKSRYVRCTISFNKEPLYIDQKINPKAFASIRVETENDKTPDKHRKERYIYLENGNICVQYTGPNAKGNFIRVDAKLFETSGKVFSRNEIQTTINKIAENVEYVAGKAELVPQEYRKIRQNMIRQEAKIAKENQPKPTSVIAHAENVITKGGNLIRNVTAISGLITSLGIGGFFVKNQVDQANVAKAEVRRQEGEVRNRENRIKKLEVERFNYASMASKLTRLAIEKGCKETNIETMLRLIKTTNITPEELENVFNQMCQ